MKVLIYDTETTGLFDYRKRADEDGQPRMIQISMHVFEPGQLDPEAGWTVAIKPDGWEMPTFLVEKLGHGMTTEWLQENGVDVGSVLDYFQTMHNAVDLISAFGIAFDSKVMRAELRRAGRPDLYKAKPEFCVMNAIKPHCKMPPSPKMAARGMTQFKTPKLIEAVKIILGEDLEGAHNAEADVLATMKLFNWLHERELVTC